MADRIAMSCFVFMTAMSVLCVWFVLGAHLNRIEALERSVQACGCELKAR